MIQTNYQYEYLNTREGFNNSLNHFKTVSALLGDFESSLNLADLLNNLLESKKIEQNQVPPIVHAMLVDKYKYLYKSINLPETITEFKPLVEEVKTWKAVDLLITYLHPELGYLVINPKKIEDFENLIQLKKNEFLTIYVGKFNSAPDENCILALKTLVKYFTDRKITTKEALKKGKYAIKKLETPKETPVKKPGRKPRSEKVSKKKETEKPEKTTPKKEIEQESKPKKMTPLYSVPVTNELFHNGNVEAWKRIILSYTTANPGLEVYIFYEGERIHDINTLFKWGKVKHGSSILFAVAGDNIKDVAKLQRYLRQGASPRFEDFLRFPVNSILKLF